MVRYLGVSGLSDAFLTAYKIPNSLRKIFAEGAVSAAFIPTVVSTIKHNNKKAIAGLMTLGFLFFEGTVLILCAIIMIYAKQIIGCIAPGFSTEQINTAVPMLNILMPLIFLISSGALLAGALQAIGHFFIPAFAPVLFNAIFILGICVCLIYKFPVTILCWFIIFAGCAHLIIHLIAYFECQFTFGSVTKKDLKIFSRIIGKFLLCLPSVGLMEIANFIDTSFASRLAPGSLSLLFYANRFIGIPLGVFAIAFSTILLPHFSRINTYSPKRLHFYLLESTKFVFWITIPIALLMAFFSEKIFSTIFLSKDFNLSQVREAGSILTAFTIGLFFFSINKILLNIFYAIHVTWIPALVALLATGINIGLNILLMTHFKTVGLATATTISSIIQSLIFFLILHKKYKFRLYLGSFFTFALNYMAQLTLFGTFFIFSYYAIVKLITYTPTNCSRFFTEAIGLWFWVGPLTALFLLLIWYTRTTFKIKLYFLP